MTSISRLIATLADTTRGAFECRRWLLERAAWPPDVFAATSLLLSRSGAYRFSVWPPTAGWPITDDRARWAAAVDGVASEWHKALVAAFLDDATDDFVPPDSVTRCLAAIAAVCDDEIGLLGSASDLQRRPDLREACRATLFLHAAADMACAGWGVPWRGATEAGTPDADAAMLELVAELQLAEHGSLARIEPDLARVLPKLRTPRAGISIRSLSHHLAFHQGETHVVWKAYPGTPHVLPEDTHRLNLLLLPWPELVHPSSFRAGERDGTTVVEISMPEDPAALVRRVRGALEVCRARGLDTHGIVFPEASLGRAECDAVCRELVSDHDPRMILAGVRGDRTNEAHLRFRDSDGWTAPEAQPKHHRWCIDAEQIHTYHLGAVLHPARQYWEDIQIPRRELRFTSMNSWLTMCHLVCEDLARLDPVSDVIRAVGPNLVIALLMDGPQLESRWPGRYASVLADDPGSSVLTFTSIGMVTRSLPKNASPSRTVALWKDCRRGARHIDLERGAVGIHLSLCATFDEELTADGRSDGKAAGILVFAGAEQIHV